MMGRNFQRLPWQCNLNYSLSKSFVRAASSNSITTSCWSCSQVVPCCSYFCPHCSKILKPSEIDPNCKCSYFELLNVPASFAIDAKILEQNFKKLQMSLHPDKFAVHSKYEQDYSSLHSAKLNLAYTTLKSPVRRALYMLEQLGVKPMEEGKTEQDLDILTESMKYRENVENSDSIDSLENLRKEVVRVLHSVEKELAAALGDSAQLNSSVQMAVRMRYLEKVIEEIDQKILSLRG